MNAEAVDWLTKARVALDGARQIAGLPLPQVAAREAYLAMFHAVEAYIFERTGKVAKTHRGVRTEFSRLARNEARIDPTLVAFFADSYEYKTIADYAVGPEERPISTEEAATVISSAERLIGIIALVLSSEA